MKTLVVLDPVPSLLWHNLILTSILIPNKIDILRSWRFGSQHINSTHNMGFGTFISVVFYLYLEVPGMAPGPIGLDKGL